MAHTLRVAIQVPDPEARPHLLPAHRRLRDLRRRTADRRLCQPRHGRFGNHNNFMDPEDYRVQMIRKPDRLNEIAERHGARWTHFYAATQRFGAEWAARQSATGEWTRVIAEMDASVRAGSKRHEYCPHIHFDYEPDSALPPQPRLIYDPATDGILPNDYYHPETNPTHRYHDWDGSARDGIRTSRRWATGRTATARPDRCARACCTWHACRPTGARRWWRAPAASISARAPRTRRSAPRPTWPTGCAATPTRTVRARRRGRRPDVLVLRRRTANSPSPNLRQARLVQFGITMDTFCVRPRR